MYKISYITKDGHKFNESFKSEAELRKALQDWFEDEEATVIHIRKK